MGEVRDEESELCVQVVVAVGWVVCFEFVLFGWSVFVDVFWFVHVL